MKVLRFTDTHKHTLSAGHTLQAEDCQTGLSAVVKLRTITQGRTEQARTSCFLLLLAEELQAVLVEVPEQ